MTQSQKELLNEFPFDPHQEFLRTQNESHMKDNGKVNDYIQSILKVLHEFELKDKF